MAKTILGVDIGYNSLKLALCKDGIVRKAVAVDMPQNLVREGQFTSPEAMGTLIKESMKQNGIRASRAALVMPGESAFVRLVTMPRMTVEQLEINLPYEFRDYITDELKNYVFDYAMISTPEEMEQEPENEDEPPSMELMAAAVRSSALEEAKSIFRRAGLRLVKAAPTLCAYISLVRNTRRAHQGTEFCMLDLGFGAVRMRMFRGDRYIATRELDAGLSAVVEAISNEKDVDAHLAHTYFTSNFENCQNEDYCINIYNNISVELRRALNFYHFSNPGSELTDVLVCGAGAVIPPLQAAIAETLDMELHQASEQIPGGDRVENCHSFVEAIGITMD